LENGRPFVGVAAAKNTISSLLDPENTAQLVPQVFQSKTAAASCRNTKTRSTVYDCAEDVDNVLLRLSSSPMVNELEEHVDATDCLSILRTFEVRLSINE
jgi:hypothetical protein